VEPHAGYYTTSRDVTRTRSLPGSGHVYGVSLR
jgi:hypothetical protein